MSFFSWLWVSGITITVRKPSALATSASPMPVLPAVPSTTVPPGRSVPRAMASRMMNKAARSLTDPPGFMNSALPRMLQPVSSEARFNLMSGGVADRLDDVFVDIHDAEICQPGCQ